MLFFVIYYIFYSATIFCFNFYAEKKTMNFKIFFQKYISQNNCTFKTNSNPPVFTSRISISSSVCSFFSEKSVYWLIKKQFVNKYKK